MIANHLHVPRPKCGDNRAEFKLESLEERTLLSTTKMIYPQLSVPAGLGLVYTAMSQQAPRVGT